MLRRNFVCPNCGEWFSVEYVGPGGDPDHLDEHVWRLALTHLAQGTDQVKRLPVCTLDGTVLVPWRIAVDEPLEPA